MFLKHIFHSLCRLPESWAVPKGGKRQWLGREWEGRIRVELDSAAPSSLTHVLVQKKLL